MASLLTHPMPTPPPKQENFWLNLAFNIVAPALILAKLSGTHLLGPKWGLVVALAFPLGYGAWDFMKRRKANFISVLGFTSVLLSGGLGLLKVGGFWFCGEGRRGARADWRGCASCRCAQRSRC